MCGIAGELKFRNTRPPDSRAWRVVVDAMWRRGPDAGSVWSDDRAVVGCRRLSIMDRSADANLPMISSDGRYVLAFNGELYGHHYSAAALTRKGWRFRTSGDTEVVMATLVLHGVNALSGLNGMYALALYDAVDQRILLARDHAGIKPLYIRLRKDGVSFASELEVLLASPKTASNLAPSAIAAFLRLGHVPSTTPLCDGIRMLDAGTWTEWTIDGTSRSGRHFSLPTIRGSLAGIEAERAIAGALRAAIERQLIADVPIGSFLSGGIDSPLLAALAAELIDQPLHTFSIGWSNADQDEAVDASKYAHTIGSVHHVRALSEGDALDLYYNAIAATKEPLADEGIFPTLALSALAKEHVGVALSGEGADELFFGYVQRLQPAIAAGIANPAGRTALYSRMYGEVSDLVFARCFPGSSAWFQNLQLIASRPAESLSDWIRQCEYENYLPSVLLKTDRASMFHSLEVRVPYLDLDVIEAAMATDPNTMSSASGRVGKMPLRALLRQRTGYETAGKRGFTAPMNDWVRGPLRELTEAAIEQLSGLDAVPHDRAAIADMAADHFAGRIDAGMVLWRLVALDAWTSKIAALRRRAIPPIR
jgi:asparagine synthase (glutamine-hydrolysing)